jgi:Tfp pilus assembly protein PilV
MKKEKFLFAIKQSFLTTPKLFGVDDLIIVGVISLIGTAISAGMSSDNANKQAAAVGDTNLKNMALNRSELAISKQQADTQKYAAEQNVREKQITDFNNKLSGHPELKKTMYDIWSGKATL